MTDLLSASPIIVLLGVTALAWFTNSKILKLATAGVFFLYPVVIGKVQLPNSLDHLPDFIGNVINYWFTQALNNLVDYIKQHLV